MYCTTTDILLWIMAWRHVSKIIIIFLIDIDECVTGLANCSVNAECINSIGSFNCTCRPGYTGDGFTCSQIRKSSCYVIYHGLLVAYYYQLLEWGMTLISQ